LERTKSGRRLEVPLRQVVASALFPRAAWEAAVAQAKIDNFTFHDTRHHFASWFMMRGGNLLTLSRILGHRKVTND
jgi:integrase